ncbi:TPA: hypothetical protein N0F65_011049 [Lagenidium giganteum]|uniref:Ty3 transposon capsid-like protein domain-containing protein n=1 Tax=Lagenidium giganteum TaxID=4803 RepID=A0AAV2ZE37_9STRA|nr:TPA: hypothetical protein N0F65_011049 [Lagenidium giganteum]
MTSQVQLRAEVHRLSQATKESAKVPNNLSTFTGKRGESSTTPADDYTWGNFRKRVLQHVEASNYQSMLREKLLRLKQTGDIETYNGEYYSLIFCVESMNPIDQVMHYASGLKPRTRSYVKLQNPSTLSEAMNLAVKYEVTPYLEETNVQIECTRRKTNPAGSGAASKRILPSTATTDWTCTQEHFRTN